MICHAGIFLFTSACGRGILNVEYTIVTYLRAELGTDKSEKAVEADPGRPGTINRGPQELGSPMGARGARNEKIRTQIFEDASDVESATRGGN